MKQPIQVSDNTPTTTSPPTYGYQDDWEVPVRRTPAGPHDWPWRDSANVMRPGVFVPNPRQNIRKNENESQCSRQYSDSKTPDAAPALSQVSNDTTGNLHRMMDRQYMEGEGIYITTTTPPTSSPIEAPTAATTRQVHIDA